ncbi:hypothetical protein X777_04003 [Ooceraea biroi]|uniref:Uncharacterized protein n=1 Tax=Ooceraea biroi TaxID=2015173 RepID=A0A026WIM7_OOCBI|nr:hypothetical protein X777_04003 [Ooceraea biroi]
MKSRGGVEEIEKAIASRRGERAARKETGDANRARTRDTARKRENRGKKDA